MTKNLISDVDVVILEHIDDKYEWIARNEDDSLAVFTEKPSKRIYHPQGFMAQLILSSGVELLGEWVPPRTVSTIPTNEDLVVGSALPIAEAFEFISWSDDEPYRIEDILDYYYRVQEECMD